MNATEKLNFLIHTANNMLKAEGYQITDFRGARSRGFYTRPATLAFEKLINDFNKVMSIVDGKMDTTIDFGKSTHGFLVRIQKIA